MKAGDFVELVSNDILKERAYTIVMTSKDQIMIDVSIENNYATMKIPKTLVSNVITKEAFAEMQEESLVYEPLMQEHFNTFAY